MPNRRVSPEEREFRKELGARIRAARKERGLTQKQVADAVGIKRSNLNIMEKHGHSMRIYHFYQICVLLKKDANTMMGRTRKKGGTNG